MQRRMLKRPQAAVVLSGLALLYGANAYAQAPADPTPKVAAPAAPEQMERQKSGLPKVEGAEPIQPKAAQPGEGARQRALEKDEQALEEKTGANKGVVWAQQATGKVASVDKQSGIVNVAGDDPKEKPLVLQFDPNAVATLTVGETIVTRTSYSKGKPGELPPPDGGPMPKTANKLDGESGQRAVTGTVTDVDKAKGRVALRGQDTTLYLALPPKFADDLVEGDRVNVEMAFSRQIDQKKS